MPLERVQVGGPEPAELREPVVQLLQSLGLQSVEAALRVHGRVDEPSLAQHPQVLGDSGLWHAETGLDLTD
jgi:hypothetical protein